MTQPVAAHVAVMYYSRNGTIRQLAQAAAEGARQQGALVRLLQMADDSSAALPGAAAGLHDLLWADGLVLATPTYYGNVSFPLKRFIDSTSPLWKKGELADVAVSGMTSSTLLHGGREATLLALYQSMYHWGALIVSAGYADPLLAQLGVNPYGVSASASGGGAVPEPELAAARLLGRRVARVAGQVRMPPVMPGPQPGPTRVVVICYPAARSTHALAMAIAGGASAQGAEVRLRRVSELVPLDVGPDPGRRSTCGEAARTIPLATLADLEWADGVALGAPAQVGAVAPELTYFVQSAEPLRAAGKLAGKAVTAFTVTSHHHTGSESALLALYNAMHHWGAVIVPPGYTNPAIAAAGGNPYGCSHAIEAGPEPDRLTLAAAHHQGHRLAVMATRLRGAPAADASRGRPADLRVPVGAGGPRFEAGGVRL